MSANQGELARAGVVSHDPDETWPTHIEIVAYFGEGRRKRKSIEIDADQFFGHGRFGAPMSGEQLIGMINKLRTMGPKS